MTASTGTTSTRPVVVEVDRSGSSGNAARWVADLPADRGSPRRRYRGGGSLWPLAFLGAVVPALLLALAAWAVAVVGVALLVVLRLPAAAINWVATRNPGRTRPRRR